MVEKFFLTRLSEPEFSGLDNMSSLTKLTKRSLLFEPKPMAVIRRYRAPFRKKPPPRLRGDVAIALLIGFKHLFYRRVCSLARRVRVR